MVEATLPGRELASTVSSWGTHTTKRQSISPADIMLSALPSILPKWSLLLIESLFFCQVPLYRRQAAELFPLAHCFWNWSRPIPCCAPSDSQTALSLSVEATAPPLDTLSDQLRHAIYATTAHHCINFQRTAALQIKYKNLLSKVLTSSNSDLQANLWHRWYFPDKWPLLLIIWLITLLHDTAIAVSMHEVFVKWSLFSGSSCDHKALEILHIFGGG